MIYDMITGRASLIKQREIPSEPYEREFFMCFIVGITVSLSVGAGRKVVVFLGICWWSICGGVSLLLTCC